LQCKALAIFLPNKVFTPGGAQYKTSVSSYWSAQEQAVKPACVVVPEKTSDVSIAVGVLNVASQLLNDVGCEVAVRSGGYAVAHLV